MTFARVKGRPTAAQRRYLQLIESHGPWMARSIPPATRRKLLELGFVELRCRSCHAVSVAEDVAPHDAVLTERGRKYLANWHKAYGSGVAA